MPWSPTSQIPHPLANVKATEKQSGQANFLSYLLVDSIIWQGLGSIINRFRNKTLELDIIHPSKAPMMLHSMRIPHTYCWSSSVLPRPQDWHANNAVTGYTLLQEQDVFYPPTTLQQFIDAGDAPVYVGFGSIVVDDAQSLMTTVLEAVSAIGVRVILATGWSGASQVTHSSMLDPSKVLILQQDCQHDWLFPRVACVVHHGGAGTTAAGLRAGRPTVVVPFFGDQFFWGDAIYRAGAGPQPIPYRELEVTRLTKAIEMALHPDMLACAERIGERIRSEDGVLAALQHFHAHLPQTGLACSLMPERTACWRSKSTGLTLSPVAATILRKEGILQWKDLELNRTMEYNVGQGPFEPISGAAWAVTELIFDGIRGMVEMIAEIGYTPVAGHRLIRDKITQREGQGSADDDAKDLTMIADHVAVKSSNNQSSTSHKLPGEYMLTGMMRTLKAAARAPGAFTASMAQGSHNMPLLWGDATVRPGAKVTGIKSGAVAGCKELALGVYDGISGLFVQPVTGLINEGPVGFLKGAGKGVVGLPIKFFAAANGIVGFPLKGIDISASRALKTDGLKAVQHQRMLQGEYEYRGTTEEIRREVIRDWTQRSRLSGVSATGF